MAPCLEADGKLPRMRVIEARIHVRNKVTKDLVVGALRSRSSSERLRLVSKGSIFRASILACLLLPQGPR